MITRPLFWICAALAMGLGALLTGWGLTGHYTAKIAALKQDHAEQSARAQADALQRLVAANAHADQLTTRLQRQTAHVDQLTKDKAHALNSLTTGRTCLGADTVRVLNNAAAGTADVPAPATGPAAAGAAVATDTDVAGWINTAQQQHEQCRARLQALIDYHAQPQP